MKYDAISKKTKHIDVNYGHLENKANGSSETYKYDTTKFNQVQGRGCFFTKVHSSSKHNNNPFSNNVLKYSYFWFKRECKEYVLSREKSFFKIHADLSQKS